MKSYLIVLFLLLLGSPFGIGQEIKDCQELKEEVYASYGARTQISIVENIEIFNELLNQTSILDSCNSMKSTICRALANFNRELGSFYVADSLCDTAIEIDRALGDRLGIAKNYGIKTALENFKDNSLKGIEYSDIAIDLLNQLTTEGYEINKLLNQVLLNRANCLRGVLRYQEAKDLYLQLAKDETGVEKEALQGLGDIACDQKRFDSALLYYQQVYPLYKEDLQTRAHLNHSIGVVYLALKDSIRAKVHFTASAFTAKKMNNNQIYLFALIDLLRISSPLITSDSIALYKEEVLKLSQNGIGSQTNELQLHLEMAADFIRENKNMEALQLIKDYSVFTKDNRFPVFYNQVKTKVKKEEFFRLASYFIAALIGIVLFLIYARKRDREITKERFRKEAVKKEKEVLEVKLEKEILLKEKEKQELREKNAILELDHAEELLKTEYDLRMHHAFLAHDLKGDATGIRNGLHALVDFYELQAVKKENLETLYQDATLLSEDIRSLSKGLEPDPKDWLVKLAKMLKRLEEDTRIKTTIEAPDIIDASLTPFIGHRILTILRVLIDNVKEHSRASRLKVTTAYKTADLLSVQVEDNGQGNFKFPEDAGVGLTSIIHRVEALNGTLAVDTKNGTTITIEILLEKLVLNEAD